ncbi:MAG TPA: hypothetical protein VNI54_07525 [Thermoanaerobaculia bacterium]|nr:hypothetical protein [Thermoanaerobaculia bacterium]
MIARVLLIAVAAVASAWALSRFAWEPVHCNIALSRIEAQTLSAEQTTDPYAQLVRARRNLQQLPGLRCTTDVRLPVLLAANEELVGRLEDAARHYEQSLAMEQRPEIYMALANVQVRLGRVDAAVESYARAVKFHPPMLEQILSVELRRRIDARLRVPQ